jgi:hypothetical protein
MFRSGQNLFDRAALNDASVVKDSKVLAKFRDCDEIMGDEQKAHLMLSYNPA